MRVYSIVTSSCLPMYCRTISRASSEHGSYGLSLKPIRGHRTDESVTCCCSPSGFWKMSVSPDLTSTSRPVYLLEAEWLNLTGGTQSLKIRSRPSFATFSAARRSPGEAANFIDHSTHFAKPCDRRFSARLSVLLPEVILSDPKKLLYLSTPSSTTLTSRFKAIRSTRNLASRANGSASSEPARPADTQVKRPTMVEKVYVRCIDTRSLVG